MTIQHRFTREQLREMAADAGRRGRTARPMWPEEMIANYRQQRPGGNFTPAQLRRWMKKRNRLNGGAS